MTVRASRIIRSIAWSAPLLLSVAILWRAFHPTVIRHMNYTGQVKQVGLALKLYADDHQGMLPLRLEDMMPTYFTRQELLEGIQLATPGAKLPELPPRTVIACRLYPQNHAAGEVHADMSAEMHRF